MRKKETDLKIIQERYNKRLERQKEYNAKKYEYINIVLPTGKKELIQKAATCKGFKNANEYIRALIEKDLQEGKSPAAVPDVKQEELPESMRLDSNLNYFN